MSEDDSSLRRVLGLTQVTASGVGIIIGAGIYVLLAPATAHAGGLVWLSFLLAAALCGLTGMAYAELASMFPRAGAEYEYTRQVAPEPVAFVVGWVMAVGLVIAAATISLGFGRYLQTFVDVDERFGAWGLLVLVTLVGWTGIRRASWLVLALTAVQMGGLLVVIAIGVDHIGQVDLLSGNGVGGVASGAALVFFAFIGFDEVITLSEETVDPTRTIPRALVLALGLSALLYAGTAIAAVSVLSVDPLASSSRPLTDVVAHAMGGSAERSMAVVALLTTTNTTLLAVTAASRILYGMAESRSLPAVMARLNRRRAPGVSIVMVVLVAAGFVAIGDLGLVAGATDVAVYVVFLAVNAVVVILRIRRPEAPRPFRIPGAVGRVPIVPLLGIVATLVMMPRLDLGSLLLGAALVAAGAVVAVVRPSAREVAPVEAPDRDDHEGGRSAEEHAEVAQVDPVHDGSAADRVVERREPSEPGDPVRDRGE